MARVYAYDTITPVVHPTAFLHPEAVLIGDVIIGPDCYIGPGAVLRGDFGRVTIGEGANVQETCVLHSFPGKNITVEAMGHIGHGAVLHGCIIGENALVGMNAVVMDDAVIGAESIVAALAFVKAETVFPPRSLIVGSPARRLRALDGTEVTWKTEGTRVYRQLARDAHDKLRPAEPLTEPEPDRPRIRAPDYARKFEVPGEG